MPVGGEGVSIWVYGGRKRENLPSRVNSKGKYPAAGANLMCSSKAATVSGVSKHSWDRSTRWPGPLCKGL